MKKTAICLKLLPAAAGLLFLCHPQGEKDPLKPITDFIISDFKAAPPSIIGAGDSALVTVRLVPLMGLSPQDREVSFSVLPKTVGGVTPLSDSTNADGVAGTIFRAAGSTGPAYIIAEYDLVRDTLAIPIGSGSSSDTAMATVLTLSAEPTVLSADGEDKATITALLRDVNNSPISGKQVSFRTTIGTIPSPRTTDAGGLASTTLTSEQINGVATVTAETGDLSTSFPVAFSGVTMTVTASPSNLVADNSTASAVTATLLDPRGRPVVNRRVTFRAVSADITPLTGTTDTHGRAVASLKSSTAGIKTVEASGAGATGSAQVTFTGFTFSLSADPPSITAGLDSTEITALLLDSGFSPVAGVTVNFSATLGQISGSGVTNSLGRTRATFASNSTGTSVITATAVLGDTLEVSSSMSIDIASSPPADIVLTANPRVVKVNGGVSTLTAVVTDVNLNPVTNVSVSFRILSGPHGGENLNPATASTSANGVATTQFAAGSIASNEINDVDIIAFMPGFAVESEVVELTIAGAPKNITVGYSLPHIDNKDGTFSLPVAAIVSDISGNAVVNGTLVLFSTAPVVGSITSPVTTADGKAITRLTYPSSEAGKTIGLKAESGGIQASSANLVLPGSSGVIESVELDAVAASILADGQSQTQVIALVKNSKGNPVGDVVVQFQAKFGAIQKQVTTGPQLIGGVENRDWGKATTNLVSLADTTAQGLIDKITATVESISSASIDVEYRGVSLTVRPDDRSIDAGGASTAIRAVLKEKASNVPIASAKVSFGTDLGTIVGSAVTNTSGVAATTLTSAGQTGTARVNAIYGPRIIKTTTVEFVSVTVAPGDPDSITITIGARTDSKEGTYSAPVSAIVSDEDGNPVADGLLILFTLPAPNGASIDPSAKTSNGVATTTLTYPNTSFGASLDIQARYDTLIKLATVKLP